MAGSLSVVAGIPADVGGFVLLGGLLAMVGREDSNQLGYIARWSGGDVAATAYGSLGALMDQLDEAEAEGRCPVHKTAP
ncbi:MAG: hypothetical protein ACRDOI_32215 [Trebonia sp.]